MVTLKELLAQRAQLEEQIAQKQNTERADAIMRVKALMAEHGLTLADLGTVRKVKTSGDQRSSSVAPKYRNRATGETWSGRGLQPKWLKAAITGGAKLEDFKI
jgi:DNA-binding protein H-NS